MSAFAAWLAGFAKSFLRWLYNDLISLLQSLLDGFVEVATNLASLFPEGTIITACLDCPMPSSSDVATVAGVFFKTLNWLFPIECLVTMVSFTVAGMLSYFALAPVLRWFKIIT